MRIPSSEDKKGPGRIAALRRSSRLVPLLFFGTAILLFLGMGLRWKDGLLSPLYSPGDRNFKDLDGFVKRLNAHADSDPVSRFVWGHFPEETRRSLHDADTTPTQVLETMLITELNRIIDADHSIYSKRLFPDKDLREYRLAVLPTGARPDIPAEGDRLMVVWKTTQGDLRFRTFNAEAQRDDYEESELSDRADALEDLKGQLQPFWGGSPSKADEPTLIREIASLLNYSGRGKWIDEEVHNRRGRGADAALNRFLLESAYPKEINQYKDIQLKKVEDLGLLRASGGVIGPIAREIVTEFPSFIKYQVTTFGILAIFSLIPGVAGLIYRRAFATWFLASFAIMYLITWAFAAEGLDLGGNDFSADQTKRFGLYLSAELWLVLLLLVRDCAGVRARSSMTVGSGRIVWWVFS